MPVWDSHNDGRDAVVVLDIGVEVQADNQESNVFGASPFGGMVKSTSSFFVGDGGIGTELNEIIEIGRIAILNGDHEWGDAFIILVVGIEVELGDEILRGVFLAIFDGVVKGILTVLVADVGIGTESNEVFEKVDMAVFGGDDEGGDTLVVL